MAANAPTSATLRAYNVGFGDCLLLSFAYPAGKRHVLIDFGSNAAPEGAGKDLMGRIAADIRAHCGSDPLAVVLTHRHKDHIAGFDPGARGKGPGAVIAAMRPVVVVQPWTEDPALTDADVATATAEDSHRHVAALEGMHRVADGALAESKRLLGSADSGPWRSLYQAVADESEEGLKNRAAVFNLRTMGPNVYVHHGTPSGLEAHLPGVKVTVVGPPTAEQHAAVQKERYSDPGEFWLRQATIGDHAAAAAGPLFPRAKTTNPNQPHARWFVSRMRRIRAEQLLRIVRMMDDAMNNTSVVLLFEVGQAALLFPGDAQIENWEYTITNEKPDAEIRAMVKALRNTTLYKVGHHGSRNATPKTLWKAFARKGAKGRRGRLVTVISTKEGKYGDAGTDGGTEVPRRALVEELERMSDYHSTQDTPPGKLFIEIPIPL
jgi:hypothetical protein